MGKKEGEWVWWYDNGQKKYTGPYLDDKKDGQWLEWSQGGNLILNGSYRNGKKWDGDFKDGKYISGKIQSP
jgi:antitoxin component YwqK of YwqJK toxin-antitoxin module